MAGADREGPDKEKERRYALVARSIAGEECPEYWKNFIKIQGENLWKIHRFHPAESFIISRYNRAARGDEQLAIPISWRCARL